MIEEKHHIKRRVWDYLTFKGNRLKTAMLVNGIDLIDDVELHIHDDRTEEFKYKGKTILIITPLQKDQVDEFEYLLSCRSQMYFLAEETNNATQRP